MNTLPRETTLEVYSYPLKVRHYLICTIKRTRIRKKVTEAQQEISRLFAVRSSTNAHKIGVSQTGFTQFQGVFVGDEKVIIIKIPI